MVQSSEKIKQILFVMAMQEEADPFITKFGLKEQDH
jgi:hypothetical protein